MSESRKRSVRPGKVVVYILLSIAVIMSLFPFYVTLVHALQPEDHIETSGAPDLWPEKFTPRNFALAWEKGGFSRAMLNTVFVAVCTTAVKITGASMAGYAFAKRSFPGKDIIFGVLMATMMLPSEVTMVPFYLMMRKFGWIDTYLPLIVPAVGDVFAIFMFRQFMGTIPNALMDAARIDGCDEWGIFWRIVMPVSKPVLATQAIFGFQGAYNDFMGPMIYLNSEELYTVQLQLKSFDRFYNSNFDQILGSAANLIACLPMIVVFIIFQRYFVEGITVSGLKN